MKIIIFILILMSSLFSDIQYNRYLSQKGIDLKVINVDINDTLNLRSNPLLKSDIITKIPYNSKSIISKKNKQFSKWINVKYIDDINNNTHDGWLYYKYVYPVSKYKNFISKKLKIKYPYFLTVNTLKDDRINFIHKVPFKYKQREVQGHLEQFQYLTDFNFSLKVYKNAYSAFHDDFFLIRYLTSNINSNKNYEKIINHKKNMIILEEKMFNSKNVPLKKIENGYLLKIESSEYDMDVYYFIINKNNKVLMASFSHLNTKIIPLQKNKPHYFKINEKLQIANEIINMIIIN